MPTSPRAGVGRELAALAPAALLLLAILELATHQGARHGELAAAVAVVAVTQVLPGALLWRLVRPVEGWLLEDAAVGFAIGAALAVPSQVLGVATGLHWLSGLFPVALAGALLVVPTTRERIRSRETRPLPWAWGAAVAVSALPPLYAAIGSFGYPLRWSGVGELHFDMTYHNALAGEVMHRSPPHYPQVAQEPLAYHWFAHAWTAQVATVSGTPLDVLLWRFNPAVIAIATPIIVAFLAVRLTGRAWSGPIAAALAFAIPDLNPWGPAGASTPLHSPMSPTQQFGVLVLLGAVAVLAVRWREEQTRASLLVLVLTLTITGGSKGSTLPVIVAGALVAAAAAALCARDRLRTVALDAALAAIILLVLSRVMFGGGDGGVRLDLGETFALWQGERILGHPPDPSSPLGVWLAAVGLLTYILGPLAGLALVCLKSTRRDPLAWLVVGGSAAGTGALVLLSFAGYAQMYFFRSAEPLLMLAGVWGALALLDRAEHPRRMALGGAAVGAAALALVGALRADDGAAPGAGAASAWLLVFLALAVSVCAVLARLSGSGRPGALAAVAAALIAAPLLPAVAIVVDPPRPQPVVEGHAHPIHAGDVRALRWLRDHSDPDDVVITNGHCGRGGYRDPCDRRQFVIASYAERGVLIEGWTYNNRATALYEDFGSANYSDDQFWDQDLLRLNDGFIEQPDAAAARKLHDLGVRWVVVWDWAPHAKDLAPYAEQVRRGATLTVYRLSEPR